MKFLSLLLVGSIGISAAFTSCTTGQGTAVGTPQDSLFIVAPESPFSVGKQPTCVAINDLNEDGKFDIVTSNTGSDDISVLLGDGSGGFKASPTSPVKTRKAPAFVATADFNRDGNLDVVVAPHDGGYDLTLLLGDGRGGFIAHPDSPLHPLKASHPHTHGLVLGDVNGDSKVDIVTANAGANKGRGDNSISVLLGDREGKFKLAYGSPFRLEKMPAAVALGDVNIDGNVDIVSVHEGTKDFSVVLGNGRGSFKSSLSPLALPTYGNSIAVADFNMDAKPDLVITHDNSSLISLLLGDGKGEFKFAQGSPLDAGAHGWDLMIVDLNRDNRMDLVMRSQNDTMMMLLGDGKADFKFAPGSPYSVGKSPRGYSVADINADGRLDLVVANSGSNNVTVLLGR